MNIRFIYWTSAIARCPVSLYNKVFINILISYLGRLLLGSIYEKNPSFQVLFVLAWTIQEKQDQKPLAIQIIHKAWMKCMKYIHTYIRIYLHIIIVWVCVCICMYLNTIVTSCIKGATRWIFTHVHAPTHSRV